MLSVVSTYRRVTVGIIFSGYLFVYLNVPLLELLHTASHAIESGEVSVHAYHDHGNGHNHAFLSVLNFTDDGLDHSVVNGKKNMLKSYDWFSGQRLTKNTHQKSGVLSFYYLLSIKDSYIPVESPPPKRSFTIPL